MEFKGDGIYFGMHEDFYHKTPYLGSSNMKQLYASPPDYWWNSHMNPMRPEDNPTAAKVYGRAIHDCILYGAESFQKNYCKVEGESGDTVSAEGLKSWLRAQGSAPYKLKADNEALIKQDFKVTLLPEDTFNAIMVASAMIVKNPHLASAFTGGFPEVSIFWHEDNIPCKARLDWLKRVATVDLKSFRSKDRIRTIDEWILQDLFNYRYDIQVDHYQRGRFAAKALLEVGKVYVAPGAVRPDYAWLAKALAKPVPWVFVFFKADGMPISKSYEIPFGSPAHESGRVAVTVAMRNYQNFMDRFGTNEAWVNEDAPYTIDNEDLPKWL